MRSKQKTETREDFEKTVIGGLADILVAEYLRNPITFLRDGRPQLHYRSGKPTEPRLERRAAAMWFILLPQNWNAVEAFLAMNGLAGRWQDGTGPLITALGLKEEFVAAVAKACGATPVTRQELADDFYEWLADNGNAFVEELAKEKGREDLLAEKVGLVSFVRNNWIGLGAGMKLPRNAMPAHEVTQVLEDWMVDSGYPASIG